MKKSYLCMMFLAMIVWLVGLCKIASAQTIVLGTATVETNKTTLAKGQAKAYQVTALQSVALVEQCWYLDVGTTATQVQFGLYSGTTTPNGLIESVTVMVTQGLVCSPFTTTALTSGWLYWESILGVDGTVVIRDLGTAGTTPSVLSSSTSLTTLPATWTSGATSKNGPASEYGSSTIPVSISISPTLVTMRVCNGQQFTATINGSTAVTWKTTGVSTISSQGYFCPGPVAEVDTVTATSNTGQTATATVTVAAVTPPVQQTVAPSMSPIGGTETAAFTVTLFDQTPGAIIYYTVNGTAPTVSSSVYTSPIAVSSTETINAIANAPGFTPSTATSQTYTVNIPVPTHSVTLSWTNQAQVATPPNAAPVVTAIEIFKSVGTGTATLLATLNPIATSYKDTNVVAGQTYNYYLENISSGNITANQDSIPSASVTAIIPTP